MESGVTKQQVIVKALEEIYEKYNVPADIRALAIETHVTLHGYEKVVREDNALMTVAFVVLSKLQHSKEGSYGRSWSKRGQLDIFFNTARKFDRIENIMLNGGKDEVGETVLDTVGDLANYGLLWTTLFIREDPETFKNWVEENLKN